MKSYLVITFIILCGCERGLQYSGMIYGVDSTFQPYYDSFNAQFGINPNQVIPIAFIPLAKHLAGQCVTYGNGHKQIEIDPSYWTIATNDERTVLIYHELGHCVFGRLHNWNMLSDGCPLSLMQISNFGDPCYLLHKNYYMGELPFSEPGDHL